MQGRRYHTSVITGAIIRLLSQAFYTADAVFYQQMRHSVFCFSTLTLSYQRFIIYTTKHGDDDRGNIYG